MCKKVFCILIALGLLLGAALPAGGALAVTTGQQGLVDKAIFFAADGLRQDLVDDFLAGGQYPGIAGLFRRATKASDNGLLTQAPPNTGAGWYTLATGAWPGVHGSTNNTFHKNGAPFANRTSGLEPGVLQAETIAQAAERGGKKVAQIEWAGGRYGVIDGPTVDYRSFLSGRGVARKSASVSLAVSA